MRVKFHYADSDAIPSKAVLPTRTVVHALMTGRGLTGDRIMVNIQYVQSTISEFLGDDQRELIVISQHGEYPSPDISESASSISDSEVTCAPIKERGAKDEE